MNFEPHFRWHTKYVHGLNIQFRREDLHYFRIIPDRNFDRCVSLKLQYHNGPILGLTSFEPKNILTIKWGSLPEWWQKHRKFNGIPLYFVKTNTLSLPHYQNSRFGLIPLKGIVLKEASYFKNIIANPPEKYIWCIGLIYEEQVTGLTTALLQKPNCNLITVPETMILDYYRYRKYRDYFLHFIRKLLEPYVHMQHMEKLVKIDAYFYDN